MAARSNEEATALAIDHFRKERSHFGIAPLTDEEAEALCERIVKYTSFYAAFATHETTQKLTEELSRAQSEVSFMAARVDESKLDVLEELRNSFNVLTFLVDKMGGEVSIPKDILTAGLDIDLHMEETEDGTEMRLRTKK